MTALARIILCLLLLWSGNVLAANRFWVGGTGSYSGVSTANWSASSGGASGASAPTASDPVIFDANSGGGTVTLSGSPVAASLTMTSAAAMTLNTNAVNLAVSGNITLGTNVTYSGSAGIRCIAACSFTSNGKGWNGGVLVNSPGVLTLADDYAATGSNGAIIVTTGTFDANNHNVSTFRVSSSGTGTRTITMGSGTWTVSAGTSNAWDLTTSTNLTLNANTSTVKMTGGAWTFNGGGLTYNNLWSAAGSSTTTKIITGANTFNDFKDDGTGTHQITFPAGATTTVATFTVSGTAGHLISLRSSSAGSQFTLSDSSGTNTRDYLDIQDSAATGGATWNAGANSVNSGNNSGWVFPVGGVVPFALHSP